MAKVVRHWHRLLREVVGVLSLEVFSQAGQSPEQPDVVTEVPAHGRAVGLGGLLGSLPSKTIL